MKKTLEEIVATLEEEIQGVHSEEMSVLTDQNIYYKERVVFPKDTKIPKNAEFVKVYPNVSEEFLNEIKKSFPYENVLHIGFGIEKYFGLRMYCKELPDY